MCLPQPLSVSHFGLEVELLTSEGWFDRGHNCLGGRKNCDDIWIPSYSPGTMAWAPPPGRVIHALEKLRQTWQKRKKTFHIFV